MSSGAMSNIPLLCHVGPIRSIQRRRDDSGFTRTIPLVEPE